MVRQRKTHARVKRGPAAQAEVLSGDGQPDEGETGEGTDGSGTKVGSQHMGQCQRGRVWIFFKGRGGGGSDWLGKE